jgi:hypothetical protein
MPNAYDVILDPTPAGENPDDHLNLGLMFTRDPGDGGSFRVVADPGQETTENPVYINGQVGMGFTEQYVPGAYGDGVDVDTMTPGIVLPAGERIQITDGYTGHQLGAFASFEWGADLFIMCGRAVYKFVNGTSTTAVLVQDLGPTVSAVKATTFLGKTIIGTTGAPGYSFQNFWSYNGSAFTEATDAGGIHRQYVTKVQWDPAGQPADTLFANVDQYRVAWCTGDPLVSANWTTPIPVGDSNYHIRNIVGTPRTVWVLKQDGVWWLTAQGLAVNVTPHWATSYDIENGAWGVVVGEYLYAAHAYGIDRIALTGSRQDIPEPCELGAYQPYSGPVYGRPVAGTEWRGQIIAAFYNDTLNKSYIMFGRPRPPSDNDPRPVVWFGPYSVVSGRVTLLKVHSPSGGPKNVYLWIAVTNDGSGGFQLYRQYMAKGGSNYQELINGGSPRFQTDFEWSIPDGWDAPTSRRVPYRYDVHADRLGGGAQVAVWADFNRSGTYEHQGSVYTSPRESFIPTDVTTSAYRVDYKIVGQGTATAPPVFRAFQPRADVNREQDPVWEMRFWIEDGQSLHVGTGNDLQDAETLVNNLWTLQSEQATPITMLDPKGNESTVVILPGIVVEEKENRHGKWGKLVTLRLRFIYGVWYWDSGATYDSGKIWS